MGSGKRCVIGGRLNSMFEGTLKLVFEDGQLQKGSEHHHSCGGRVSLITMEAGTINAGIILTCASCNWRYAFDTGMLTDGENAQAGHHRLLDKLFGYQHERSYYCTVCLNKKIKFEDEKCEECKSREAIRDTGSEIKT